MITEKINKPYTYAIGWSKFGVWYYGVRYSKKSYVGDIWKSYFTSSLIVKNFVRNNGNPDIIKIVKVFDSIEMACIHESKFLRRVKANTNPKLLNAHCAPAIPFKQFEKNCMHFPKVVEKMATTKKKNGLIAFVRNKNFIPSNSSGLKNRILNYIEIIKTYKRNKNRIMTLLISRLHECNTYCRKPYPVNRRNRPKYTEETKVKISNSKIGKKSYYNPITNQCKMFDCNDIIPEGWLKGLIKSTPNNNTPETRKKISKAIKKSRSLETEEKKQKRVEKFKITLLKKKQIYHEL
jgi:hypothetical protein